MTSPVPPDVDMDLGGFALLQMGIGADKIYGWFKDGKGPERTTDTTQQDWEKVNRDHIDIAYLIEKAVRDSGASWEGAAGDQARASTSPLASWSQAAGDSASTAGQGTAQISESFRLARDSVEKPVDVPDKPWYNDALPWDTDYDDAVEKSQEVNSKNMQVLSTYGNAANAAGASMPTFQSPDEVGAGIDDGGGQPPIERPKEWGGVDENGTDKSGSDRSGGDKSGNSRPSGDINVPPPAPPGDDSGGNTRKSWADVPDRPTPPPNIDLPRTNDPRIPPNDPRFPPFDPRLPYDPRNPNDPRNPRNDPRNNPRNNPNNPNRPPVRLPGGGGGGGQGGSGGGRGPGGVPGMGGAGGGRMPGMGGLGGGVPGPGAFGPGGTSGTMGPGERGFGPGGGGFGPGGAGAAGRGGPAGGMAAGGMGAGAGRGQGDEDKEHKSASYLQETEDIFGDGTMVAPPVIGE
ncbi:hypothetical protein [Saccharothrix australiensis]|uniref:hypothetical protein n=1 Tax=Saccharothrix australiensis TaxID=2072 RepID=UPI0011C45290|nr:hypothetical protein [Saccharothrix australiensis]